MITLGSCIGMGFFLASPNAISRAGPGVLLTYVVASGIVFLVLRALGELLLFRPVSGSFACYADEFIGKWAGFVTGWAYWLLNVVVGTAQITAAGELIVMLVVISSTGMPWKSSSMSAKELMATPHLPNSPSARGSSVS
jgi:L-asparagine transporter-like permease